MPKEEPLPEEEPLPPLGQLADDEAPLSEVKPMLEDHHDPCQGSCYGLSALLEPGTRSLLEDIKSFLQVIDMESEDQCTGGYPIYTCSLRRNVFLTSN